MRRACSPRPFGVEHRRRGVEDPAKAGKIRAGELGPNSKKETCLQAMLRRPVGRRDSSLATRIVPCRSLVRRRAATECIQLTSSTPPAAAHLPHPVPRSKSERTPRRPEQRQPATHAAGTPSLRLLGPGVARLRRLPVRRRLWELSFLSTLYLDSPLIHHHCGSRALALKGAGGQPKGKTPLPRRPPPSHHSRASRHGEFRLPRRLIRVVSPRRTCTKPSPAGLLSLVVGCRCQSLRRP